MEEIGLFYGSDTGVTDDITKDFVSFWEEDNINVMEIGDASVDDFKNYSKLILGLPTWYDGVLQSDWEDFFEDFNIVLVGEEEDEEVTEEKKGFWKSLVG